MGFVKKAWNDLTGKTSADAAKKASRQSIGAQAEALDYLKEQERVPSYFREEALGLLGGLYGIPGMDGDATHSQQQMIDDVMQGPFYENLVQQGEEAVLRNASATGDLRSGNILDALAQNSQNVLMNLVNQRQQGLQGLAFGIPSNANQIAEGVSGIGRTQAMGTTAAAQARQQGVNNLAKIGLGIGGLAFSDPKLKKNIKTIGQWKGFNWCTWVWNEAAEKLGLRGYGVGLMADEVQRKRPDLVCKRGGYLTVYYGGLINE